MTQEEKELLLKDLSARLPYGVICKVEFKDSEGWKIQNMSLEGVFINECYFTTDTGSIYSKEFKPYLRPMSSMTDEEKEEFHKLKQFSVTVIMPNGVSIFKPTYTVDLEDDGDGLNHLYDWLNKHHFDYRGLIEKGLALEALEGMYNIK